MTSFRLPSRSVLTPINVADPANPVAVGQAGANTDALYTVEVANDLIATVSTPDGLAFYRYTGPRTVAGRITLAGGAPLPGVTVWAGPAHATADSDGAYYIIDVPPGDHTVRPALSGYTFAPPQTAVSLPPNRVDLNFTATAWAESRRVVLPVVGR